MTDVVIVGAGVAGTCLAHELINRGLKVQVYNDPAGHCATMRAAGVINPITGRRFVKTWKADELIPLAWDFYSRIGNKFGVQLIFRREILHALDEIVMEENWSLREGDTGYQQYMHGIGRAISIPTSSTVFGNITGALQVNFTRFIELSHRWFRELGIMRDELSPWNEIPGFKCVYCEGVAVRDNPHFNWLPNMVAKGEALICRIPELNTEAIIKTHGISIAPLWENEMFWIGSTYEWDNYNPESTTHNRELLESKLRHALTCDYTVEQHVAGLRPTAKDRRPFIGLHPERKDIMLLNGLGTKGASLAPFCAQLIADYLTDDVDIPSEVNLLRYYNR